MNMRGFTLIELMITVVIVAIIATLAVPAYQEYVAKTRRAEAAATLLEAAQFLERAYSANGTYLNEDGDDLQAGFPTQVPATGTPYYTIGASGAVTRNSYVLRATRTGIMAGDGCGDFQLNQAAQRSLNGASGKTLEECWRR